MSPLPLIALHSLLCVWYIAQHTVLPEVILLSGQFFRIKSKCLCCNLHFVLYSWYENRHQTANLVCPECHKIGGVLILRREQVAGEICFEMPGPG